MVGNAPGWMALMLGLILILTVSLTSARREQRMNVCQFTEIKRSNCTRIVYYPCPQTANAITTTAAATTTTAAEDSGSSEEEDDAEDDDNSVNDYLNRLISRYYRRRLVRKWCRRKQVYSCIMYRCYVACCPGWKYDRVTKQCSIRIEAEEPDIDCLNGGSAVKSDDGPKCVCPAEFTGKRCEERLCSLECHNDGICDVINGEPQCVCSSDFDGKYCETPRCDGGCVNGQCVITDGRSACRCRQGFVGKHCELTNIEKEGECPQVVSNFGTCAETCKVDNSCPGDKKCCFNGCGHMCTTPAATTCTHNGVDYNIGDGFTPDNCHVCTCLTPDATKPFGGAKCTVVQCPSPKAGCDVIYDDNTCCGHCKVVEPVEEKYTKPLFTNCPQVLVTLDVEESINRATLPFTLQAKDYKNNKLKVTLSRSKFKGGIGADNFDTVVATSSRDVYGNYAYCHFHVRIRDLHPPSFTFCPSDVSLTKEGEADWDDPEVKDNVGLVRPPTSRSKKTDHYATGEHLVVYLAEDHEGNTATCKFFVMVSLKGSWHDVPSSAQIEEHWSTNMYYAGIGLAALLIVIMVVIVVFICKRRQRLNREESPPAASPPSYDNAVYGIASPQMISCKEKPPIYDCVSIQEKKDGVDDFSSLDVMKIEPKCGVDNPTYRC